MTAVAIEARGLTKRFDDHLVLDTIDFTIEPGRIVGYVGTNGSGKSTTFDILASLLSDLRMTLTVVAAPLALNASRRLGLARTAPVA